MHVVHERPLHYATKARWSEAEIPLKAGQRASSIEHPATNIQIVQPPATIELTMPNKAKHESRADPIPLAKLSLTTP